MWSPRLYPPFVALALALARPLAAAPASDLPAVAVGSRGIVLEAMIAMQRRAMAKRGRVESDLILGHQRRLDVLRVASPAEIKPRLVHRFRRLLSVREGALEESAR